MQKERTGFPFNFPRFAQREREIFHRNHCARLSVHTYIRIRESIVESDRKDQSAAAGSLYPRINDLFVHIHTYTHVHIYSPRVARRGETTTDGAESDAPRAQGRKKRVRNTMVYKDDDDGDDIKMHQHGADGEVDGMGGGRVEWIGHAVAEG